MKRVFLLIATNVAVLVVLSIVASLLGVDRFLTQNGLNLPALLAFSAVFGFGGAFISLAMSKWMAKRSTGAQVITEPRNARPGCGSSPMMASAVRLFPEPDSPTRPTASPGAT